MLTPHFTKPTHPKLTNGERHLICLLHTFGKSKTTLHESVDQEGLWADQPGSRRLNGQYTDGIRGSRSSPSANQTTPKRHSINTMGYKDQTENICCTSTCTVSFLITARACAGVRAHNQLPKTGKKVKQSKRLWEKSREHGTCVRCRRQSGGGLEGQD